jgi:hypothetical protein
LVLSIIGLRYASYKGAVKSDIIFNLSDSEGVSLFTFTTGSLRDNKLWAFDIGRDLAVARGRVFLTFLSGLVKF